MIVADDHFDAERVAFLALGAIKGVGFETLRRFALADISFRSVIELDDAAEVRRLLGQSKLNLNHDVSEAWHDTRQRALEYANRRCQELALSGVSILFPKDRCFPRQLSDLRDAPCWLFVQGNVDVLSRPSLSVVGSRKASDDGVWLTQYVGHWLKEFDAPTVSGLAEGIDQYIHIASIKAKVPTIAFLGTGIFTDYPKGSDRVRDSIIGNGGAVATEYLMKESYSASNFVRRNRLQAALGRLLVPTEWAIKSGTAHTVRYAHTLRRPIAFLRTPLQPSLEWVPREYRPNNGFFTLPSDQDEFVSFVENNLKAQPKTSVTQLKLL
ncbi:DNA-processing protein DprA [uncultured Ruegeria sp.]|uniref:DNA-processing protein DprA n=1 Tax=uncultured Ruegeria sp. TaxID=259304 RepID=UPI00261CA200|nr:DNA-processing protein DprA [uncultured Ruegeria sp.]